MISLVIRPRAGVSSAAICMRWTYLGRRLLCVCVFLFAVAAEGQIQVDLKFKRLQYIAYEPVVATLGITNLAGRDIELHDANGQSWLGFEVTGNEGQPIAPLSLENAQPPLKIEAGQRVTRQIDLGPLYPVHDFGAYHVRTNVYFADLRKFFYSATRVFEVTDARPIWQQTVGIPDGVAASGDVRTYSLLTNRFPDHTSLYVRVQDKDTGIVYATYSLGRAISSSSRRRRSTAPTNCMSCIAPRREPGPTRESAWMANCWSTRRSWKPSPGLASSIPRMAK